MTCIEKLSLGAYSLGTLDPGERADVESHLDRCEECREALAEFAALPGLLSRVSPAEMSGEPVVPTDAAFRRLMVAAGAQRRSRRRRVLLAAAAAIVVALAAGAAVGVRLASDNGSATATVAAASGPVHARAALLRTDSGSRVKLWLRGVPPEERCRLVAIATDGHRETASSWEATYSGEATVTGAVSIPPRDIVRLVVETFDGRTLVELPVTA